MTDDDVTAMADGWTTDTLFTYLNARIVEVQRDAESYRDAHTRVHDRIESHFDDQTVSRGEWDEARQRIQEAMTAIQARVISIEAAALARADQRNATGQYYAWIIAGMSFVVSLILLVRLFLTRGT